MNDFVSSQEIMKKLKGQVLGGAKVPHSCSFPVIRKVEGEYKLVFFIQLVNRELLREDRVQRPAYWCCADLNTGDNFVQFSCKEAEFCTAPYDRTYKKGAPQQTASKADAQALYEQLDDIRGRLIRDGILDAFAYKSYLNKLFTYLPAGQINFYKELSKVK